MSLGEPASPATGQTSNRALVAIYRALGVPGYGHEPPPPTVPDEEFEAAKARILKEYLSEGEPGENRQTGDRL